MRKLDLANSVKEQVGGMSKKEAADLVRSLLDCMREAIVRGDGLKLSGFGNFTVRKKNNRVGRNPHSGKELTIPARRVLTFRPSQLLRELLNG